MSISDLLANRIWGIAQGGNKEFKKLERTKQKNIILGGITLALGLGLFFSTFSDRQAHAQNAEPKKEVSAEVMDPLNRINKGVMKSVCVGECQREGGEIELDQRESALNSLVGQNPISAMVPFIAKRDKPVAAFLVAIAKKESDWGKHTPKKAGKECFNFWGYRGGENPTQSGYSCFDSPEHAVKIVGNRIEKLVNQKINTPDKMVVWKCGRDCEAAGGQAAANKWVSDVAHIYNKLQS